VWSVTRLADGLGCLQLGGSSASPPASEEGNDSLAWRFGRGQPQCFGAALPELVQGLWVYDVRARAGIWPGALSAEVARAHLARFRYELGRQPWFVDRFQKYYSKLMSVYSIRVSTG